MSGPLLGILGQAVGGMLASQVGSGLGALASEVLSVSDIGLPLAAPGKAAIVPANVDAFAAGLDVSADDVLLYVALREAAHQRLFAHVPWLRDYLIGAVTDYARGIEINAEGIQSRIEEQMRGHRPHQPRGDAGAARGRHVRAPSAPPPRTPRCSGSRSRSPWSRAGSTRSSARPPPSGCRRAGQAAGGVPSPPRRRRTRRADLRDAGRARAAPAPAARRLHAVGLAAHPAGHRGPRRRVDAPRPAAHAGRPRRPAGLPRGRLGPDALSDEDFDAELKKLLGGSEDGPEAPEE